MSEPQTPNHQTQHAQPEDVHAVPKRRFLGGRWLWIALLLIVIGVGVQQLVALRFWESLDNEAEQISTVEDRLAALEASMADQSRLRADVELIRQALQQERALLGLDRIEQQIDAGWQVWVGTGDPKLLILALQNAQRSLSREPEAPMQALRIAVSRDLVALKSQQVVDLRSAVESIDAVIASIDRLPLVQDRRVPPDTVKPSAENAIVEVSSSTLLEQGRQLSIAIVQDVWHAIRSMIRVQRLDRAEVGLVAPEQKVFLQQGLRLLLLDARHALIMRNAVVFQQTLSQARAWIVKYADGTDTMVKDDLAVLQHLANLQIDPEAVSLEDTRKALIAARAALAGESVADNESTQSAVVPINQSSGLSQELPKALDTAKGANQ